MKCKECGVECGVKDFVIAKANYFCMECRAKLMQPDTTDPNEAPKEWINPEQTEYIKLIKNSRGYGWEIKLLETDVNRLELLNNDMQARFNE